MPADILKNDFDRIYSKTVFIFVGRIIYFSHLLLICNAHVSVADWLLACHFVCNFGLSLAV